ncbi:hypothetical protein PYCCODRAFT_1467800 [Trametes coccinea BRFM310]|uniref:Stealth protein CR3 conserved region 3 domain-containing protein n=1 Tax=Trametes coccinea (strain BRFM310) TaxID=1353009 RepID=A0A1Y2IMU6_TRAC3|nr:hypothetical protein PYCCODRAFT_1467800 [Trametes coccinea BRFM310]
MTSATYIPLTQISPSEYSYPSLPFQHNRSRLSAIRAYFTRRRAVYALIGATSLITLLVFLKVSASHHDDFSYDAEEDIDIPVDPQYQPSYIAIPVPPALPPSSRPRLRPVRDLPPHCLDALYSSGDPCHDALGPTRMDVVWTWVNGSDPLFADVKERAIANVDPDDPYRPINKNNPSRMFRDHDELRHSIRSVLANFRPYANRFRILTSDFDYPEEGAYNRTFPDPGAGYWRLGLQPQWLETAGSQTRWRDGHIELSLTHHAHFMEPYNYTNFNSYAIESQFIHLPDLTETFIYMNDDFYMVSPLTPASFYTSPYGIVLRLQSGLQVSPDRPTPRVEGEWRSMGESNWLLSNRFGRRHRPYVVHEAKAVSAAIVHELGLVWPAEIAETATHRFRETEAGHGDFYLMFMHAHYIVERAREALLWAWAVGRIGTLDDGWGDAEADRAWTEVGGMLAREGSGEEGEEEQTSEPGPTEEVHVHSYPRETLDPDRVYRNLHEAGYDTNTRTEIEFSSMDGFPYGHVNNKGTHGWGNYGLDDERPECTIKRSECFDVRGRASDVFKHIAFENPSCGDCIIQALVKASGPLGLSAFLPSRDRHIPMQHESSAAESWIPHLPLVKDWHDGQFALRDVMQDAHTTSVRDYALMVLQRYRYVIGGTPSIFERLMNYAQVRGALRNIDNRKDLALLCINDDLGRDDPRVAVLFTEWQEKKWPTPAAWEADVAR